MKHEARWLALGMALLCGCDGGDPPMVDASTPMDGGGGVGSDASMGDPDAGTDAGPVLGVAYPDTPAGRQIAWVLGKIWTGDPIGQAEYEERLDPSLRGDLPREDLEAFTMDQHSLGEEPPYLELLDVDTERWLLGYFRNRAGRRELLAAETSDAAPFAMISAGYSSRHIRPPGADTPPSSSEVDFLVSDPVRTELVAEAVLTALDASTGEPLSPTVTATTDEYGFARLTRPSGDFGLRVTHSDGTVTDIYTPGGWTGGGAFDLPAYDRSGLSSIALRGGFRRDATKAYVLTVAQRDWGWTSSVGMPCATAAPSTGTPRYVANGVADADATETDLSGEIWVPDLEPGAAWSITVTDADATDHVASAPTLVADRITVVGVVSLSGGTPGAATCLPAAEPVACSALAFTPGTVGEDQGVLLRNSGSSRIHFGSMGSGDQLRRSGYLEAGQEVSLVGLVGETLVATDESGACLAAGRVGTAPSRIDL